MKSYIKDCLYGVAGVGGLMVVAPVALTAVGFAPIGITAGSIGAWMMATLGSGSVVVASLQSAGAAGVGLKTMMASGAVAVGIARIFDRR